ncbi:MAG: hypothetical protein RL519_861, partial [Pseudomonadota bacterium]
MAQLSAASVPANTRPYGKYMTVNIKNWQELKK